MVSDRPDLLLTVTVADCLPIFLADPRTGAFGLVHSGWKGTGIVVEAVRAMTRAFGSRAADIAVTIGPGIGPCCYAVPAERHERFRADFGGRAVQRGLDGSFRLDLRAANAALLEREGIGQRLDRRGLHRRATRCWARSGGKGPGFTRMLAFIGAGG